MPKYGLQHDDLNTVTTPSTSATEFLQSTVPPYTGTSDKSSDSEAGPDTKNRAGEASGKPFWKPRPPQTHLPPTSKRTLESESSDTSSGSAISTSSKCAKKKRKKAEKQPTKNHLKIRAVVDAGRAWELDLERVHGLTDEEACIVVSKVTRYSSQNTFPDPRTDRFMKLAHQGWKLFREAQALQDKYPECLDQTSIDGEWKML